MGHVGRLFPGPGLPAAAAALRGGPSRSHRALKASPRGGRTRSEPPAPAMGSLGRCLARGLLWGQPGIRLPFGSLRCYGSGETRPRPTLRAVPIPVLSHPLKPLRTRSPSFSLPRPWGPLPISFRCPVPSLVSPFLSARCWDLRGQTRSIPQGTWGELLLRAIPFPVRGRAVPCSSCTALTAMGTLVPAGRVLSAYHSFGARIPPHPALGAWGTSQ